VIGGVACLAGTLLVGATFRPLRDYRARPASEGRRPA
jgi:hypothetical protein